MISSFIDLLLPPDEITRSTIFWRSALRESLELFHLEQFFMWMQLFKYLPETEYEYLVPPTIVFDIWYLFMKFPLEYSTFSRRFCGRYISLSDCKSLGSIDLTQAYRYWGSKQRYRYEFENGNEYEIRHKTMCHVARIHGIYDLSLWNPDYVDPEIDSCFGGKSLIKMADGSKKVIRFIKIGIFPLLFL